MSAQYYMVKNNSIIGALMTARPRHIAQELMREGVELKTEDEIPVEVLKAYEYWATRP